MSFNYLAIKLLRAVITIWVVITFTFIVLMATGDPIDSLVGDEAPQEVVDFYRAKYGLDKPLYVQYFYYIGAIAHGDFGISFSDETPALDLVLEAIPKTLKLGGVSYLVALLFAIPMGVLAALHRNKPFDRAVMSFAVFGFSIPNFFFGILLILFFSLWLRLLPSSGSDTWLHLILPVITLSTHQAGSLARFTRSSVLEVLNQSYMRTAKAKGVPNRRRLQWHALPNAAIPIVTILGLRLGSFVAGSIIVESVFAWPGVGRLLVNAVSSRELAVVQAILIIVATSMVFANVFVDILYSWIDPRIRTGGTGDKE